MVFTRYTEKRRGRRQVLRGGREGGRPRAPGSGGQARPRGVQRLLRAAPCASQAGGPAGRHACCGFHDRSTLNPSFVSNHQHQ